MPKALLYYHQGLMDERSATDNRESGPSAELESARRLATLLSNLPGMAYRCKNDCNWTMEFVSDGCEALTGYKAVDLVGNLARSYNSLIHPQDQGRVWNEVQDALAQHLPYRLTYRIAAADGRVKWVWEQGVGIYSDHGLEALEGFITDITDRMNAEQRYRLVSENAADVIWLWNLAEGRCVYISPSVSKLTGFSPEEIMARKMDELMPPDTYRLVLVDLQRRISAVESGDEKARVGTREIDFLGKDGSSITTETATTLLSDEDGVVRNALGVTRDITERKLAQAELALNQKIVSVAQTAAKFGVFRWDAKTGSSHWSNEFFQLHRLEPATTAPSFDAWFETVHLDDRSRILREFRETLESPEGVLDIEYRSADGSRWMGSVGQLYRNGDGTPNHMIGIDIDLTDRKRAEEEKAHLEDQLRQAQKMESIGRLAGGVAHDFNNLLTVINGYSGILLKELGPADPRWPWALEISKAGERASGLTRQLLAFSRKQMIQPRVMDLNGVVTDLEQMLGRLIGADITVAMTLDPGLGRVMADPDQIHQVLMNLVVNARDAMPSGGRLHIETQNIDVESAVTAIHPDVVRGRCILMTVTDSGVGMDKETLQRAFEPFFTTKEEGKGTGLGLSTVYGIVQQSGGWIDVESEPGKGTAVRVYLPRIDVAPDPEEATGTTMARRGGGTVLIVEDQGAVRKFTKIVLESRGYTVLEAAEGGAAMRIVEEHCGSIALLLTDVVLPGMNGWELSEQVRLVCPDLKVLFMSGYAKDVIAHRGLIDQKLAYIQKPFTADELDARILEVLADPSPPR